MKVKEIYEYHNSEHDGVSNVIIELTTNTNYGSIQIGEGELEDMSLNRDLNDVYKISDLLKFSYEAGKRKEEFQYELMEEK